MRSLSSLAPLLLLPCLASCCTIIAVGSGASTTGASFVAHTDDAGGGTNDIRVVAVPAADHEPGSMRAVYDFNAIYGYPRITTWERGEGYFPKDGQKLSEPMGYIPQVAHTYAYFDQGYGMMHEHQLSFAESTCEARTVG